MYCMIFSLLANAILFFQVMPTFFPVRLVLQVHCFDRTEILTSLLYIHKNLETALSLMLQV